MTCAKQQRRWGASMFGLFAVVLVLAHGAGAQRTLRAEAVKGLRRLSWREVYSDSLTADRFRVGYPAVPPNSITGYDGSYGLGYGYHSSGYGAYGCRGLYGFYTMYAAYKYTYYRSKGYGYYGSMSYGHRPCPGGYYPAPAKPPVPLPSSPPPVLPSPSPAVPQVAPPVVPSRGALPSPPPPASYPAPRPPSPATEAPVVFTLPGPPPPLIAETLSGYAYDGYLDHCQVELAVGPVQDGFETDNTTVTDDGFFELWRSPESVSQSVILLPAPFALFNIPVPQASRKQAGVCYDVVTLLPNVVPLAAPIPYESSIVFISPLSTLLVYGKPYGLTATDLQEYSGLPTAVHVGSFNAYAASLREGDSFPAGPGTTTLKAEVKLRNLVLLGATLNSNASTFPIAVATMFETVAQRVAQSKRARRSLFATTSSGSEALLIQTGTSPSKAATAGTAIDNVNALVVASNTTAGIQKTSYLAQAHVVGYFQAFSSGALNASAFQQLTTAQALQAALGATALPGLLLGPAQAPQMAPSPPPERSSPAAPSVSSSPATAVPSTQGMSNSGASPPPEPASRPSSPQGSPTPPPAPATAPAAAPTPAFVRPSSPEVPSIAPMPAAAAPVEGMLGSGASSNQPQVHTAASGGSNAGAIAAGVLVPVVVLAAVAAFIVVRRRRRRRATPTAITFSLNAWAAFDWPDGPESPL